MKILLRTSPNQSQRSGEILEREGKTRTKYLLLQASFLDVRKKTQGEKNSKLNKKTQNSSSKLRKSAFFSKKNCKKYSVGKLIDAPIDENTPNSRKKLKNSRKKLKTQAKNSKSRHFLDRCMPEMRSKRKPALMPQKSIPCASGHMMRTTTKP